MAKSKEIDLKFIQKGKPHQNGYVERFNRSYREEVLDVFSFNRLKEAQLLSNAWVWMYNNERPHSSLGYKTPVAFMQERLRGYASPTFLHEKEFSWNILLKSATN